MNKLLKKLNIEMVLGRLSNPQTLIIKEKNHEILQFPLRAVGNDGVVQVHKQSKAKPRLESTGRSWGMGGYRHHLTIPSRETDSKSARGVKYILQESQVRSGDVKHDSTFQILVSRLEAQVRH